MLLDKFLKIAEEQGPDTLLKISKNEHIDLNAQYPIPEGSDVQFTPLTKALKDNNLSAAKALILAGVDVNQPQSTCLSRLTPLHLLSSIV